MSESHPDPFVGRTFGGYRVEGVIGRGGMGTVYLAQQLSLGRPVAIKVLPLDLAREEQFLERFHREADALSRLSHPNVVAVYDRGEIDGQPYLVMEYVEGASLREVMRDGPLALEEALRVASAILAALDHAHEKGIVHRDIKPENVLLSRDGVVKVADFGLSRLLGPEENARLTRTQLVLGTYEYMAPEQRERAREADPRSDLYAAGVVLYEMLSGELPIGRFAMPSQRRASECDGRVDALIERSLEKSPERRFGSAREMAVAVEAIRRSPRPEPVRPAREAHAPQPEGYRATRLEYHIDNLATIDHVLGTLAHVAGFFALFGGMGLFDNGPRGYPLAFAFVIPFLAGWYLRSASEGLRKYRQNARTAQAVIAIAGAFTVLLIPLSVYSFWVLFSHRGRTYYEARGRGLDEHSAARHTYRVLEEPYAFRPPAPPPPAAPRPSQIPVQSIVTSEVRGPAAPRRSRLVTAGWRILGLTFLVLLAMGAGHLVLPRLKLDEGMGFVMFCGVGLSAASLGLGLLHALFSAAATGTASAVGGLFLCGLVGLGTFGFVVEVRGGDRPLGSHVESLLGWYEDLPPATFERDFFAARDRVASLERVLGEPVPSLQLQRRGKALYVRCSPPLGPEFMAHLRLAVQKLVDSELNGNFRRAGLPE